MNIYEESDYYYELAISTAKALTREAQIESILDDTDYVVITKEETNEWKEYLRCQEIIQKYWYGATGT